MSKQNPQPYKGNGQHEWEIVNSNTWPHMRRLRVPGGWLYTNGATETFVPMPEVVKHKV
jgi:hypothetical protein